MTVGSGFGALVGPAGISCTLGSRYCDQKLAIDIACDLHALGYHFAVDLFDGNVEPLVRAIVARALLLHHLGIVPIFVFDGEASPDKSEEDNRRAAKRNDALAKAVALERASAGGKQGLEALNEEHEEIDVQKKVAVRITWDVKFAVLCGLVEAGFEVLIAPFEADHTCAFLQRSGYVKAVLSVDFDMLTLGVTEFVTQPRYHTRGITATLYTKDSFKRWEPKEVYYTPPPRGNWLLSLVGLHGYDAFMYISLLWRNDYIPHINGLGPTKIEAIGKYLEVKRGEALTPQHVTHAWDKWLSTTDEGRRFANTTAVKQIAPIFSRLLIKAFNAFRFPPVYDPKLHKVVRLNVPGPLVDPQVLLPLGDVANTARCEPTVVTSDEQRARMQASRQIALARKAAADQMNKDQTAGETGRPEENRDDEGGSSGEQNEGGSSGEQNVGDEVQDSSQGGSQKGFILNERVISR